MILFPTVLVVLCCVRLFATPWTGTHQVPLSMGFPRQEYWSGLPFSSPGDSSKPRDWTCLSCIAGKFCTAESSEKSTFVSVKHLLIFYPILSHVNLHYTLVWDGLSFLFKWWPHLSTLISKLANELKQHWLRFFKMGGGANLRIYTLRTNSYTLFQVLQVHFCCLLIFLLLCV